ncbi:hypothetical protein, partial [Noviherbaspirillum galbum]|uniref:hypothetical protein n=1 Tax=Noviherbaspirillum galbum TaxID=2709383 RepID=UPI00196A0EB7
MALVTGPEDGYSLVVMAKTSSGNRQFLPSPPQSAASMTYSCSTKSYFGKFMKSIEQGTGKNGQ